jgi:hypothetical protein
VEGIVLDHQTYQQLAYNHRQPVTLLESYRV